MATMVMEKKREKKKSKQKGTSTIKALESPISNEAKLFEEFSNIAVESGIPTSLNIVEESSSSKVSVEIPDTIHSEEQFSKTEDMKQKNEVKIDNKKTLENVNVHEAELNTDLINKQIPLTHISQQVNVVDDISYSQLLTMESTYKNLSNQLQMVNISSDVTAITEERDEQAAVNAYLDTHNVMEAESTNIVEEIAPSAPIFEEMSSHITHVPSHEVVVETKQKISCMAIEDVVRMCGGAEMEEVRVMSEKEEAIVEAGPKSGPEHPLVDLLSTFRSSLIAVERERVRLAHGYADEQKSRATLWKIEKRYANVSEQCPCGAKVDLRASYEHAQLMKERLPVSKLRLEGLLRDVQDSYCHHQHAALLAHCQIEELISETVKANKNDIREALSLILQALRLSDSAPVALAGALQRWAAALAAALVDARDLRQLLFVLHHLFRQTRSVSWAGRVLFMNVESAGWARTVAVLDLLLSRTRLETALECSEDTEEVWEEVDRHGGGGAVSDGTLRERDLLALLTALPLRQLASRPLCPRAARLHFGMRSCWTQDGVIVVKASDGTRHKITSLEGFNHLVTKYPKVKDASMAVESTDIKHVREHDWCDSTGGREVLKSCCCVRVLLAALQRGSDAHSGYARLRATLRSFAANTLHALACLHLCSRTFYSKDIEEKLTVELEAAFAAGFILFGAHELNKLPATLLSDDTAKDYCVALIVGLHDTSPRHLSLLSVQIPVLSCDVRVRIVTQAAIDRADDHELATIVLEFLLQTGVKRKTVLCKGTCDDTARRFVPELLAAHPYMYAVALHMLADINQTEVLDASSVKTLHVDKWKPNSGEIRALLDDWSQRCAHLLQHLLLQLDNTPYIGLTLEVQLTVGSWVSSWVKSLPAVPEWVWQGIRQLRPHRASWHMTLDAPPPDEQPTDLFSIAYALLSSSWGHCIPLICSEGVPALCKLAASRPREAVHCLSNIMLVMAHSPESIALTPKFSEVITTLVNSGPSLVQRALGRGGVPGSEMLLRLILAQLSRDRCGEARRASLLSAWLPALCRAPLPPAAAALADVAALATRDWPTLDAYAAALLQEETSKDHINYVIRNVSVAPLLCECVLRAYHTHREACTHEYARLLTALCRQRAAGQRIHVDNAIQQIGANMVSEELTIYRSASAALSAPTHHPSHLALWRLFMHLYLQRPPEHMLDSTPPVGPLFFNGLIKSRSLAQIKRRLQETKTYHHNELETLKQQPARTDSTVTQSTAKTKVTVDDDLLPALSIVDMTGESSDSSESTDSEDSAEEGLKQDNSEQSESADVKKRIFDLITYHTAAEKLIGEYLRWLEDGDKVRAAPHHADIARFIPEHALETAWKQALSRETPPPSPELDSFPLPLLSEPPNSPPPQTPFHKAVASISKIRDRSTRRRKRIVIKSPVEDVDFKDSRTLLALVDKHLKDIERLAEEWCNEVSRVSSLDARLWELVAALRVRRPLPPVKKQCPNKCKPVALYIPAQEWCVSEDASRGVRDNRSSAAAAVRRLARPRPHAARTAAALHAVARRVRSGAAGVRVCERAWRCAAHPACACAAPARLALTALLQHLAERWIQHDGPLSAELVSRWCSSGSSALQQALCGALVAPRCLPAAAWPPLYAALLAARLPPHATFSYLSKFELSRWSETADSGQRRDMVDALTQAIQRFGPAPADDATMLVELLGVHTALLLDASQLGRCVIACARASVAGTLPPTYWTHVVRGVQASADQVPFDQLGHLLRELGVIWWEARTGLKGKKDINLVTYAQHIAQLLHVLLHAFVAAAVRLSYEPERVAWYSWSASLEAWAAWVAPQPAAAPLLPSTADDEQYTLMLRRFVDNVHQIMRDCPGTEVYLLQHIFEWCVQTYASVQNAAAAQESRVQASALLAALTALPWTEHPWFYGRSLQVALQVSTSTDKEITSWCCNTWSKTTAATLMRDCTADGPLAPTLAKLLCLFTGTLLQHSEQILEEATLLPWWRLPEPALDEALDRFFMVHHNPEKPYHELPQFKVVLYASELCVRAESAAALRQATAARRHKRGGAVSRWLRAATAPALAAHVVAHTACVLDTLTRLAPFLEGQDSEGELEELLSRAVVIMCIEPAATAALPVWVSWVSGTWWRLVRACVSAAAALTTFQYFAPLADAAAQAHMLSNESNGWREICARWSACPWHEPHALLARGALHAAYACAGTGMGTGTGTDTGTGTGTDTGTGTWQNAHVLRSTPPALLNAQIHFVENEVIVAVWICFACRLARECRDQSAAARECGRAGRALLAAWADPPRRSILRLVTLHADTDVPTPLHRLLCRFALYLLNPSEVTARAYETACTSTLGPTTDLTSWASTPHPKKLPRLAARLFPNHERYFKLEMDLAPDESG